MSVMIGRVRLGVRLHSAWRWLLRNWVAVMLPPAMFLLVASVTRQSYRAWEGAGAGRWVEHVKAADIAIQKGDPATALREADAAEPLTPETGEADRQMASILYRSGHEARALDHMERSYRLRPKKDSDVLAVWIGLAESNYLLGRMDVADRLLREEVLPRWPDSPDAHCYVGRIALHRDGGEVGARRALPSFEEALRLDPRHMDARKSLGDCMARLGRWAEAERAYRAALEINPKHRAAARELASVLRREGRPDEAKRVLSGLESLESKQRRIRHLESRVALGKSAPADLRELGELYLAADNLQRAEQALLRYTKQEPTDPGGHRLLAEACRRLDRPRDAELSTRLAVALEAGKGGDR